MDIERAFKAPFVDQKWHIKTLWAALWAGLGVTAPALTGYSLDYIRNVAHGYETPLPEWNREFGRWWVRGFLAGLAAFIYLLPAIVLLLVGSLPLIFAAAASSGYGGDVTNAAALLGSGTVCLTTLIAVIYAVAVSVFFYGAFVNYALSDDFGALFRVGEIMARLRTPDAGYFGAWGMSIVIGLAAGMVAGLAGSLLGATVVLAPVAGFVGGAIGFLGNLMTSHLFGQYAGRAYGLPGLVPAPAGPASAYPTYANVPPAPPAYAPVPQPAPVPPAPPAPEAPLPPASSAHSEPDSPMPPHSPEQAAPPSGPFSDPPAEGGGA